MIIGYTIRDLVLIFRGQLSLGERVKKNHAAEGIRPPKIAILTIRRLQEFFLIRHLLLESARNNPMEGRRRRLIDQKGSFEYNPWLFKASSWQIVVFQLNLKLLMRPELSRLDFIFLKSLWIPASTGMTTKNHAFLMFVSTANPGLDPGRSPVRGFQKERSSNQ